MSIAALILWIAQGFGTGRCPVAPGTAGSLVGLLWFVALLVPGSLWFFMAGLLLSCGLAVWLCHQAELLLRQTDPVSVVLDEIVAVPLCFVSLVGGEYWRSGHLPAPGFFFQPNTWLLTLCVLATFRLVDVFKPWPVRQSQSLPGGWGVVVDDLLAAIYVNLLTCLVWAIAKFCR